MPISLPSLLQTTCFASFPAASGPRGCKESASQTSGSPSPRDNTTTLFGFLRNSGAESDLVKNATRIDNSDNVGDEATPSACHLQSASSHTDWEKQGLSEGIRGSLFETKTGKTRRSGGIIWRKVDVTFSENFFHPPKAPPWSLTKSRHDCGKIKKNSKLKWRQKKKINPTKKAYIFYCRNKSRVLPKSRDKKTLTVERLWVLRVKYNNVSGINGFAGAGRTAWGWSRRLSADESVNGWMTYRALSCCSPGEGRFFQFLARENPSVVLFCVFYVSVVHLSSAVPLRCYMSFTDQSAPGPRSWQPEVSRENSSPLSPRQRPCSYFIDLFPLFKPDRWILEEIYTTVAWWKWAHYSITFGRIISQS